MGRARVLAALLICVATVWPWRHTIEPVHAQTATPTSCSGSFTPSPMEGEYSGTWTSDALYHFEVFGTDLHLEIEIDGTLNGTVSPSGVITGTASGSVQAPITHDGAQDVSSGYGTISGAFVGSVGPTGASIVLSAPVIDMHWGTFVGGGYTVEKFITMPDYAFSVGSEDCVSASGAISETDFPIMAVVADGANEMTYAPGVGTASGSWSLQSAHAATFAALSSRVDAFIAASNAVLQGGSVTAGAVQSQIAVPMRALLADIAADPTVSRCLLERLAAWEVSVVPALRARAAAVPLIGGPAAFRSALDLARSADLLAVQCPNSSTDVVPSIVDGTLGALDNAASRRDWSTTALLAREALLADASPGAHLTADLHVLAGLGSITDRMAVGRMAYAVGDDADARVAIAGSTVRTSLSHRVIVHTKKKPKKKKSPAAKKSKPTPKPSPKPKPTAKPTPRPTPTPSLTQVLTGGIESMTLSIHGSTATWSQPTNAASYVVAVTHNGALIWMNAGSSTSATLGDTSLDGVQGSADDLAPSIDASGDIWSVLALDASGAIVGGAFQVSGGN